MIPFLLAARPPGGVRIGQLVCACESEPLGTICPPDPLIGIDDTIFFREERESEGELESLNQFG